MALKRLQTAKNYIDHFATLDSQVLESILADDHTHEFAPASMNPPGPFTKQGFIQYSSHLREIMAGFPVTGKEFIESDIANQVTVWATSQTIFRDDVKDNGISHEEWEYKGEYIFMFWMDETGEKIVRTVEFLDSKGTDSLRVLMKRANENREKRHAEEKK